MPGVIENSRPRGRPPKVHVEPVSPDTIQWKVAEVVHRHCGIPGCGPKFHLVEASEIMELFSRSD